MSEEKREESNDSRNKKFTPKKFTSKKSTEEKKVEISLTLYKKLSDDLAYQKKVNKNLVPSQVDLYNEFIKLQVNDDKEVMVARCGSGEKCLTWKCSFGHPEKIEYCYCKDKECSKLHRHQAICKNPKHKPDCDMAHNFKELNARKNSEP